jgi:ketosteroid isomerase-like protein
MKPIIYTAFLIAAMACTNAASSSEEVLAADRAFSKRSAEKGLTDAFLAFAADDLIKPSEGLQPVFGKEALRNSLPSAADTGYRLTWEPLRAEVSGDLGYTFGAWTRQKINATPSDTTSYGNYVTIWKRQADGTWKWVLDTGNSTPGLTSLPR